MADTGRLFEEFVSTTGQAVNNILTDRFHKKQFEDFQKTVVSKFHEDQLNIMQAMSEEEDPDKLGQHFINYRNTLESFMTEASGPKWAGNPYIAEVGQRTFNAANQGMDQYMALEGQVEERKAKEKELGLEERKVEAVEKGLPSEIAERRARAAYYGRLPVDQEKDITPDEIIPLNMRGSPADIENALSRPDIKGTRDFQILNMWTEAAQNHVRQMQASGQKKFDPETMTMRPWGEDMAQDIEDAKAAVGLPGVVKLWKRFQIQAIGQNPDDPAFGGAYSVESKRPESELPSIKGAHSEARISTLYLGGSNKLTESLGTEDWGNWGADKIVRKLPNDLNRLQGSYFGEIFKQVRDSGGQIMTSGGPRIPKSADELSQYFRNTGEELIKATIGGGVDDGDVDALTLKSRKRARKLLNAMIEKYGDQITEDIFEKKGGYSFETPLLRGGRALSRGAETVKEALGGLLRGTSEEEL